MLSTVEVATTGWSPIEKTALAEAEIEYHDKESFTVWVKFKVVGTGDKTLDSAKVVIWTTTPWTLPGNVALAVGKDIDYVEVKVGEEVLVLDIETGTERGRVRVGGLNQGVVFPSVGWGRDLYWCSMSRVARVFVQ